MLVYPVELKDDDGTVLVEFPDVPEAITYGDNRDEALIHAVDALETMLWSKMKDKEPIALPSPLKGRPGVALPALTSAKVLLYVTMRKQGVGKAELARRLNCHLPQVDRLLDLSHASRLDQIEAAFAALGKRIVIEVKDTA
jgi:antitoxin HicB